MPYVEESIELLAFSIKPITSAIRGIIITSIWRFMLVKLI